MKREIITISLISIILFGNCATAQSQFSPIIARMEKSLFGIEYNSQSDEMRLKRIEENVYGSASAQPVPQRVSKLTKDIAADLIGNEIKPKADTFADADDETLEPIPKADGNINYPVVDQLEKGVFNNEFKKMDINQRLSNLEKKVFNKSYSDDLNSRVERLKMAISPEPQVAKYNEDEYVPDDSDVLGQNTPSGGGFFEKAPNYNSNNSVLDEYEGEMDVTAPIAALERSVLKRAYADDSVSNRLSRLEGQVLHSNFSQDDPQTRLDRLSSATRAQRSSSKYDNNKFSQHMSTAMQIGAMLLMVLACVL